MSDGKQDAGLLVRYVEALDPSDPPTELPLPARIGSAARIALTTWLVLLTAIGAAAIVALWVATTPGWWFSAIFTVFIVALMVAGWAAYGVSVRQARQERAAAAAWSSRSSPLQATHGRIADRVVNLGQDGGDVTAFVLTVVRDDEVRHEVWWEPGNGISVLLQPQLPPIGADVLVWTTSDSPSAVVDVLDPTRLDPTRR